MPYQHSGCVRGWGNVRGGVILYIRSIVLRADTVVVIRLYGALPSRSGATNLFDLPPRAAVCGSCMLHLCLCMLHVCSIYVYVRPSTPQSVPFITVFIPAAAGAPEPWRSPNNYLLGFTQDFPLE